MKIEDTRPTIKTGGQSTYEESFAIGNLGRIMKILRSSMYAHPIKAICREIASNARDAHREHGIPHQPIEIHLPNNFDEHFTIKDYGPGISPDRMSNVFIRYGTSTKNDDDSQTGGFGLGAKTPFAYTDQFQITTIAPNESGQNIKSIYIAYIDESEAGKMRLMHSAPTDEPSGTEISIVVSKNDFYKFSEALVEVCQYWNPRPELTGSSLPDWPEENRDLLLEGVGWKIFKNKQYDTISLLIVDGISYPINIRNIDGIITDSSEYKLLSKGITIFVNTGDVTLSANREELQYDNKTCDLIKSYISNIIDQILKSLIAEVGKHTNYREACLFFHEFKKYLGFTIPDDFVAQWNGNELCGNVIHLSPNKIRDSNNNPLVPYHIDKFTIKKNRRTYKQVLSKESVYEVCIDKNCVIILNDISNEKVSRNRIQHYIDTESFEKIYVITFGDQDVQRGLKQLQNNKHNVDFNWLNPILISTINPPRKQAKSRGKHGSNRAKHKAFIYDEKYISYRSCDNNWRPTEIDMVDGEGVYVVLSGRTNDKRSQNTVLTDEEIRKIISYADDENFEVYGFREKDINKIGEGWIPLKMWVEEKVSDDLEDSNITFEELRKLILQFENTMNRYSSEVYYLVGNIINKWRSEFSDESTMIKYYDLSERITEQNKSLRNIWNAAIIFDKTYKDNFCNEKDLPLAKLSEDFNNKYPMIKHLKWWPGPLPEEGKLYFITMDNYHAQMKALDIAVQNDQPIAVNE